MISFENLLSRHAGTAMLKQIQLASLLGQHNWNVDLLTGKADFDRGRLFPIQVIGSESEVSNTWLWGWANEASAIPAALLTSATELRDLGARERIAELTEPQLPTGPINGHALAAVAVGVCGAGAYYRGPYDGGALFFTLSELPAPKEPSSPVELINVMTSVISQFTVEHRLMASSFLGQQGYALSESADKIVATSARGGEIVVAFDGLGRISGMETMAGAVAANPAKRPWWKLGKE